MPKPSPSDLQPSKSRPATDLDAFQRVRHARYFEDRRLYHVIVRTTQGLYLLRPDARGELRRLIAGIIGHARGTYPGVKIHAAAVLSNHGHLALSGDRRELAAYVGFFKRELSRRWGPRVGWHGLFEEGYHATAVLTADAQRNCLKYILGQGVAEGLVARPADWPGFHCAESLVTGLPAAGEWLNATRYGAALEHERRKRVPRAVDKADFIEHHAVAFDKLPALAGLCDAEYRKVMATLVAEVVTEGRTRRAGKAPLGVAEILATKRMVRSALPAPPWFVDRRRMVLWDNPSAPVVRRYLARYWEFQRSFREAADRWLSGDLTAAFPAGSFRPGFPRPTTDDEALAA